MAKTSNVIPLRGAPLVVIRWQINDTGTPVTLNVQCGCDDYLTRDMVYVDGTADPGDRMRCFTCRGDGVIPKRPEKRTMNNTTEDQCAADIEFRDSLGRILNMNDSMAALTQPRRDYVRLMFTAMSWWISSNQCHSDPEGNPRLSPRDRILMLWAQKRGTPMLVDKALDAIEAQAEHRRQTFGE